MHKIGFLTLISWWYSKGVSTRDKLSKIQLSVHLLHWDLLQAILCFIICCYFLVQHTSELGISSESLLKLVLLVYYSFLTKFWLPLLLQIQAYVMCNKLRSAYLVSVRQEKTRAVQLVQHVRQLAENSGDDVVKAICAQWLSVHQPKMRNRFPQGTRK